jgi:UDP-glucose 4-epimerase
MTSHSTRPVVVTGGAGFIGSHVVDRFRAAGERVIVVDDLSTGSPDNLPPDIDLVELDISTAGARAAIADLRPSLIVHAAAQASVSRSTADPVRDAEVNIVGSVNVIGAAADAGTRRFVYLNTGGALYGLAGTIPTAETEPIRPISPYGLSKWTAEEYLRLLKPPGAIAVSLRLANVYGPRQSSEGEAGVVAIFAERMLRGAPIEIHGDGLQTRDFVYVEDVAAAAEAAARAAGDAIVNIGTGVQTTILELCRLMSAAIGYDGSVTYASARPGDVRDSALDPSTAERALGWRAGMGLQPGLQRTLAWYRRIARQD